MHIKQKFTERMDLVEFEKWEASGNDFILIWDGSKVIERAVCERHYGVGADGVLYLEQSHLAGAECKMRIVNADGSEAEMCGNGLRCVAQYMSEFLDKSEFGVETGAGLKNVKVLEPYDSIEVEIGKAAQEWRKEIEVLGRKFDASFVNVGNPHCVIYLNRASELEEALKAYGPTLSQSDYFPEGANVEFAVVESGQVKLLVWERGVGRTQACGTGACATAFIAMERGLLEGPVKVELEGGLVEVKRDVRSGKLSLIGPARRVFMGEVGAE